MQYSAGEKAVMTLVVISGVLGAVVISQTFLRGVQASAEDSDTSCIDSCRALGAQAILENRYGCICQLDEDLDEAYEDLISRRFVLSEPLGD